MTRETKPPRRVSELAKLLRAGRAHRGWSLRQAGTATGISNGYLSLIEQGAVQAPSPRYLMALASAYDIAYDDLLAAAGHPSGSSGLNSAQTARTPGSKLHEAAAVNSGNE